MFVHGNELIVSEHSKRPVPVVLAGGFEIYSLCTRNLSFTANAKTTDEFQNVIKNVILSRVSSVLGLFVLII